MGYTMDTFRKAVKAAMTVGTENTTQGGYKVKKIQPVDMFPFTEHIETIVKLIK